MASNIYFIGLFPSASSLLCCSNEFLPDWAFVMQIVALYGKNTFFRGGGRSAVLNGGLLRTPRSASCPSVFDGKLGFLREYLVSIGPHKQFAAKISLRDVNRILANPKVPRFFSSEAPKEKNKNYEDFCPEEKMEIPNGDDQKSESKGDRKNLQNMLDIWTLILFGLLFTPVMSFELEEPLEPGSVASIKMLRQPIVGVVAQHFRSSSAAIDRRLPGYYVFLTADSFEEKLKEAQGALGIDPDVRVPITYVFDPKLGLVLILMVFGGLLRLLILRSLAGTCTVGHGRQKGGC